MSTGSHPRLELAGRLVAIVGEANVIVDAALMTSYTTDWTGRWSAPAALVVRPRTTAEVAGVLRACAQADLPVVPQGGNTSLVGGSVPRGGEVVLSTSRLREVGEVDLANRTLTVGAGVPLAVVHDLAAGAGLAFGVDLAARGSATVGGMAATNAGGLNVVAFGPMADNVLGLEVVLADGGVVDRLHALPKDTAGYDLGRLIVGSEGTLGVITRLKLRLVGEAARRGAALLAFDSVEAAVEFGADMRDDLPGIRSLEIVLRPGMELVCAAGRLAPPFPEPHEAYVFVEVAGRGDAVDALAAALDDHPDRADDRVAIGPADVARLLAYRERQTEAIATLGVPYKFDVAVALDDLARFVAGTEERLAAAAPGARLVTFGHLAEGNLHVNVLPAVAGGSEEAIEEAVLALVLELGGTISAEHGIGVAKVPWLARMRGPADLAAMAAVKRALDPQGRMNPGVIFPADSGGPTQ